MKKMKLQREEQIRKQIREILLGLNRIPDTSLNKKRNDSELKQTCYNQLVDLKGSFELSDDKFDKNDAIEKIDDLMISLRKVKNVLGRQLS